MDDAGLTGATRRDIVDRCPILIVHSNDYSRRTSRGILHGAGLRYVLEARDGLEALAILGRITPSNVIVAWEGGHAFATDDFLRILRDPRVSADPEVPIVVTTPRPTRRLVRTLCAYRVRHLVRSPYSPKILLQRIAPGMQRYAALHDAADDEAPLLLPAGRDVVKVYF